jgi:hypothetical protein
MARVRADAFLLNCADATGNCWVVAQTEMTGGPNVLAANDPVPGRWFIVIRARERVASPVSFHLSEAMLKPSALRLKSGKHESGSRWTLELPAKTQDAQYAAFRIAGNPD